MPVTEMVVPRTIGPSQEFSFAEAGEAVLASANAPAAITP